MSTFNKHIDSFINLMDLHRIAESIDSDYYNKVWDAIEEHQGEYSCIGVRFDRLSLSVGDPLNPSKELTDPSHFPEYGTEEYDNLPDLSGTSAYEPKYWDWNINVEELTSQGYHVYVIGGDSCEKGDDSHEIIIQNAVVLEVIV